MGFGTLAEMEYEPGHSLSYKCACAPCEDSNQQCDLDLSSLSTCRRRQRKSSMENYKLENAPMLVRRSDTTLRTPSKPSLKTSTYYQSNWNRLHRIEPSGEAS